MSEVLVDVRNLVKYFPIKKFIFSSGSVKAVDGVSFHINRGETLGLVGESGCGKTTVGRVLLRLIEPTSGEILFEGKNLLKMKDKELKEFRKNAQIIFQDPYSSLNPRMTVFDIVSEPLKAHGYDGKSLEEPVLKALELVGLKQEHMYRYPHEFSGGQRQRIAIARAIILKPKFLVLDEPTSALDVSVQAQILNMLKDFQEKLGLTYLFISHDLSVVHYMSNRVAVMYLGKIIELADVETLFKNPLHPYTQMLLSAIPVPDPELASKKKKIIPKGEPPSPINPPPGCRFNPRCPYAFDKCRKEEPQLTEVEPGHLVACHMHSRK